jgi:enamine deaminase RidA (YjgF/YER057c/UK114 family)
VAATALREEDAMSELEHYPAPDGMAPGSGYSHVVAATGERVVAVSGQVAMDEAGDLVGHHDPRAQAEQAFANLRRALSAAGASFADIVKLSIFVTDSSILPTIREVRDRYVDTQRPPASTAVQVAALFQPGYLLEIEALAVTD